MLELPQQLNCFRDMFSVGSCCGSMPDHMLTLNAPGSLNVQAGAQAAQITGQRPILRSCREGTLVAQTIACWSKLVQRRGATRGVQLFR